MSGVRVPPSAPFKINDLRANCAIKTKLLWQKRVIKLCHENQFTTVNWHHGPVLPLFLSARLKGVHTAIPFHSLTTHRVVVAHVKEYHSGHASLRPDEIMKLPASISLIIKSGFAPVKAKQFVWYKEDSMKYLPQKPMNIPCQVINIVPFEHQEHKTLSVSEEEY